MRMNKPQMIETPCPVCRGYCFIAIPGKEPNELPDCEACNGKGIYYRPQLTKAEAVKLRGSVQVNLDTLDNLPYDGGSICLGCLYYDDCLCEPQLCNACDGLGFLVLPGQEEVEEHMQETKDCRACEGEGQIYPPCLTVAQFKKQKGYS